MKQFLEVGWGDGDSQPHGIDWNDPLDQLIASEELGDATRTMDVGEIKNIPTDALLILLRFLVPPREKNRAGGRLWRATQLRVAMLAHLAGLEGVAELPLAQLARELGCTRSLLSLYGTRLADSLNQHSTRAGRTKETRHRNSEAAVESHRRRGHKMAQGREQPNPGSE